MRRKHKHRIRNFFLALVALGFTVFFIISGIFLLWASTLTMPTIDIIEAQRRERSTKIFDRSGEVLLYDMHQDVRRIIVPLEDISDNIKHATIAIEDDGFYKHHGIEPLSIIRAIVRNLQDGDLLGGQGGSTITQQVVKNTLLVQDKKISRKLKEWVLAMKLEREVSKDEILEIYLNESPYGGIKYGVEEASQGFFGKSAKDVSVVESAYLAALPQAPTYYSPYGNNRDALDARKNLVLERMYKLGYISEDEYNNALIEEITFRPHTGATIKAPHFVFYVLEELSKTYNEVDLAQAGLHIITTLDWELQREAETIVFDHAMENTEKFNASNASLMAVDPKTGAILVMVGSRDYFDNEIDGNFNIGLAERQPGSSFKPFAYAAAMQKGYTSETVVYDVRTQFSTGCDKTVLNSEEGCYSPGNYDNKFRGPMTFREALAQSVNVPAVKALYLAGMPETLALAQNMGVSTLTDFKRYGLTLVLGGGEVSLLDMTSAYGVFANEGYRYPHTSILSVTDSFGKKLQEYTADGEQVLDTNIARSITNILADNRARTPAFGSDSYLHFATHDVAVKTGTTNDYRDAWIIGYTPNIAVGAWAGNNDNSAMEKKVAGFIIAPMWNKFMNVYFEKQLEEQTFNTPEELDAELKPVLRGFKYTNITTQETGDDDDVVEQNPNKITEHSILHWVLKDNPLGPTPSVPALDPQYRYWEYGILFWRLSQGSVSITDIVGNIDDSDEEKPKVEIDKPANGERFRKNETVDVRVSITSEKKVTRVSYYIDGKIILTKTKDLKRFSFMPGERGLEKGDHTLMIIAYDTNSKRGGVVLDFVVR